MNLSCANSDAQIERIRRSFAGAVFGTVEEDGTNRVVFACAGDVIRRRRFVRPNLAMQLSAAAWSQLKPAFMRVASAMRSQL